MPNRGFSHIGLATHDLEATRAFYEGVLGFKPCAADAIRIAEGGQIRHMFFDVGREQLLAFMQADAVPGVPQQFDAGINAGLGLPGAFYHFAFEAGSPAALAAKRDELRAKGVEVSDVADHGWARSIYLRDPNGISLEYCCQVRDLTLDDATMQVRFTAPRAALDLGRANAFDEKASREKQLA
jgi:catechol 2,3-dioxygenase-like lactoylglutathione lyase family enzyme